MVPVSRSNPATILKTKPALEIIPDQKFLVFNGDEHEASPIKLTGRVRLHARDDMSILKPKIRLEGKRKISWWFSTVQSDVMSRKVFWEREQKLGSIESAHKVKAGIIEWPFEFELDPAMPESVEGLRENYFVYHLNASVGRPGWNTKDVVASEHIRIVRTMGAELSEMTQSRLNSDVWANKVAYTVSIPSDAVVFGTSIVADVELTPLKKGLRFGKVEMRLLETVVKRIQSHEIPDLRFDRSKTDEIEVAKETMDIPEQARVVIDDDFSETPTLEDEKYKFIAVLPLPKSLNVCRQDVDHHQITITHRVKIVVNLLNPEGHTSQLVCRLPVRLFISPNLPVDESNQVNLGESRLSEAQLNNPGVTAAPPEYGRHQLDQIYSDIDISGFISRAGSGPSTPAGLLAQSRRGSHDNVLSLNTLADTDPASLHHSQQLQSRLAGLQLSNAGQVSRTTGMHSHSPSGTASPVPGPAAAAAADARSSGAHTPLSPEYHSHNHTPVPHATGGARGSHTSYFPGAPSTATADYDLDGLSRVPSYGAALRTPTGNVTPFTEGPPSYVEATSRPPSPGPGASASSHSTNPLPRPSPAHVRAH